MKKTSIHDSGEPAMKEVPFDDEFWTVVQRYFSFEEPSSRWSKLRKSLQKQLKRRSSSSDLESMTLNEQSRIFSQIFGNGNGKDGEVTTLSKIGYFSNQIISVFLAFEDIKRFNSLAYDSWALNYKVKNSIDETPLAGFLAGSMQLTDSETAWLALAESSYIDWQRLDSDGPWNRDPRIIFLNEFKRKLSSLLDSCRDKKVFLNEHLLKLLKEWSRTVEQNRGKLPADFLPRVVLLVEGQSEEILVPKFCHLLNHDLNLTACAIKKCGGARQVVKQYLNLRDIVELPVVSVLDADVAEEAKIIKESLREKDRLFVISNGELEDSFSDQVFITLINKYIAHSGGTNFLTVDNLKNPGEKSRAEQMKLLWRRRKLGTFDKVEFASCARDNIKKDEVPRDFRMVSKAINEVADAHRKLRFD